MKKHIIFFALLLFSCAASAQTFTFECFCKAEMTGDSCDICPGTPITSRSFSGLLVYRNGVKYKWIDEPYMVRRRPSNNVEFLEQGPTPEKITIALSQTPFSTIKGFIDSTFCQCGDFSPLFYASDSTNLAPIYPGDTLLIVGQGSTTVVFDSLQQKYVISSTGGGGSGTVTNFSFTDGSGFDGLVSNPTTTPNLSLQTTVTGVIYGGGGSLLPVTIGPGLSFSAPTLQATDQSATNEAQTLTVSGTSTGIITLNQISGVGGGTATVAGGGINAVSQSGGTITITGTEVDGSVTNELQTISNTSDATSHTATLSSSGGSVKFVEGTGIGLATTGTTLNGIITITNTSPLGTGTDNYHPKWAVGGTSLTSTSMIYDNGTNIGIASTNPFARVHNVGDYGAYKPVSGGIAASLYLGDQNYESTDYWYKAPGLSAIYDTSQTVAASLGIYSYNGTRNLRAIVKPDGKIGIGVTNPATLLHVQGTARITGSTGTPTSVVGRNANGDISNFALGTNLSITSGTLNASGSKWTDISSDIGRNSSVAVGTVSTVAGSKFNVEGLGTSGIGARFNGGTLSSLNTGVQVGGNATASVYGLDVNMTITGTSNNLLNRFRNGSTGNSINQIVVGSTAGGDPYTQYQVEGANTWSVGVDNSAAADPFKIARTSALGSSIAEDVLVIETDGRASIGGAATISTVNLTVAGTGGVRVPGGNVSARPIATGEPIIRHNTQYDGIEAKSGDDGWHLITSGAASPTLTATAGSGTGLGVGGTASIGGNYKVGTLTFTVGSTGVGSNVVLATVNYPVNFSATPFLFLFPANTTSATNMSLFYVSANSQASSTIRVNGALAAGATYNLYYLIQN